MTDDDVERVAERLNQQERISMSWARIIARAAINGSAEMKHIDWGSSVGIGMAIAGLVIGLWLLFGGCG